jgi:hypothetical protein
MELGILIASSIAVGSIAAYYYVWNIKNSHPEYAGKSANKTIKIINNASYKYSSSMKSI